MNDLLEKLGMKVLGTVGGVLLALAFWSMTGSGDAAAERLAELPPVVLGGGGGTVSIELTLDEPGRLEAVFERYDAEGFDVLEAIEVDQELASGVHNLRVELPDDVSVYLEARIPDAKVGARIEWTVSIDGETATSQSYQLDEAPPPDYDYALAVMFEIDSLEAFREDG